jgi:hypothetical protein
MATPNMVITKPTVSSTAGPTWAENLNTALDVIDAHDHSSGKGTQVTPAGININADVEFNDNKATEVKGVSFQTQGSQLTGAANLRTLYVYNGELYYRDASGNQVQLTSGGVIRGIIEGDFAGPGIDASISYADATKTFTFYSDSGVVGHIRMENATIDGSLTFSGAVRPTSSNIVVVSGDVSVGADDYILLVDTSAARVITLPSPATRRVIVIKDKTGSATTNNITVARNAAESIEGVAASKILQTNWGSWTFVSDGTDWLLL